MGGPYNIPRNYKGENKILFVFSLKSFLYTLGGGFVGVIIYYILKWLNLSKLTKVGLICIVIFALIGFAIGTFKIPDASRFEFSKKVGGESIDDVIVRWFKFKRKNNRIYVYKEEELKDDRDDK